MKKVRLSYRKSTRMVGSDVAVMAQFKRSMESDNEKRKRLNAPIAKYDVKSKRAYLEYPDGRKIYAHET